jgi:hypothetical protein
VAETGDELLLSAPEEFCATAVTVAMSAPQIIVMNAKRFE